MGGEAVANGDNVADWEGAQRMVNSAIEAFGDLDILVNNAGILRDRVLINMTEQEWDDVIAVHLKGHFAPTRWAATYWREQTKAGIDKPRNIVHTSSTSGLLSNPGQSNYGAAKSGIATFSQILAKELVRYGVKSNCIAPAARTRLTLATPGLDEIMAPKEARSTSGTRRTCRPSCATWPRPTARSPARRSSSRAAPSSASDLDDGRDGRAAGDLVGRRARRGPGGQPPALAAWSGPGTRSGRRPPAVAEELLKWEVPRPPTATRLAPCEPGGIVPLAIWACIVEFAVPPRSRFAKGPTKCRASEISRRR